MPCTASHWGYKWWAKQNSPPSWSLQPNIRLTWSACKAQICPAPSQEDWVSKTTNGDYSRSLGLPQTGWLTINSRSVFPCSSGGQKFEIKVFTAWCSLQRLAGRILPCFFQHMVVAGHARHSLVCSFISLFFASILTRPSSCVCLCLVFPLCVCVSPFSLPIRTPVIGLGPTLIRYDLTLSWLPL